MKKLRTIAIALTLVSASTVFAGNGDGQRPPVDNKSGTCFLGYCFNINDADVEARGSEVSRPPVMGNGGGERPPTASRGNGDGQRPPQNEG